MTSATALAHPNIAFIKYWGNRDDSMRLPANGSISMNLEGLFTRTRVTWKETREAGKDIYILNNEPLAGLALQRVSRFLDLVRKMTGLDQDAQVISENNFPSGAGIASSASAFAALAVAATAAAGLDLDSVGLSRLARRGSGSACRSVPGGFVEWMAGETDLESFAVSIAPPDHWNLVDVITLLSLAHKTTGSTEGHALARTSLLQGARVEDAPRRLSICRQAIIDRDFSSFADIIELDSTLMHAVMMTSTPPLFYWQPETMAVMQTVREARAHGRAACATIDAGPNVHVICEQAAVEESVALINKIPGVQGMRLARVGDPVQLLEVE